jgi:hypothetical protein
MCLLTREEGRVGGCRHSACRHPAGVRIVVGVSARSAWILVKHLDKSSIRQLRQANKPFLSYQRCKVK